jgi:hypothetical protein
MRPSSGVFLIIFSFSNFLLSQILFSSVLDHHLVRVDQVALVCVDIDVDIDATKTIHDSVHGDTT